jgi:hypothetical protein
MLMIKRHEVGEAEHAEDAKHGYRFVCRTCPYQFVIDKEYFTRKFSKVKEVDDVMGGAAAWENVDQTNSIFLPPHLPPSPPGGLEPLGIG